jgi:SH3-like domain-containing protein
VRPVAAACLVLCALALAGAAAAEQIRPKPAPNRPPPAAGPEGPAPTALAALAPAATGPAADPGRGPVTSLPLPRYVTLKGNEGNARRGPGRTHRIDWVFTRPGMPLRVTAEYENWRLVEDAEGIGGWVHYALLSGSRAVLVEADMTPFHSLPDPRSPVVLRAERGVIARVLQCEPGWCRLAADGRRGWAQTSALWGVDPGEVVD